MEIFKIFEKAVARAKNIVITTHAFPDADGIGSEIALAMALKKLNKNVICCNDQPLLKRYKYLDPENIVTDVNELPTRFTEKPDIIIVVDTNNIERTGKNFVNYFTNNEAQLLFIDHHPCPLEIKSNNCIDTTAAATGQLVGNLIQNLGIKFDQTMALALYTAILIDTSSFRYPTVTDKTHNLIAELLKTGIQPPQAYNGIYGTKKIEHMHLLSKVLGSADSNANNEVAWIVIKKEELEKYGIDIEDTHGFINNLLILDHVKVACMFRDDGDQVKLSLRSNGSIDVGGIAIKLGGGGHSHSAATIVNKTKNQSLDNLISESIEKIEKAIPEQKIPII